MLSADAIVTLSWKNYSPFEIAPSMFSHTTKTIAQKTGRFVPTPYISVRIRNLTYEVPMSGASIISSPEPVASASSRFLWSL